MACTAAGQAVSDVGADGARAAAATTAVMCGASFDVLCLDASLVEAGSFAARWDLLLCLATDLSCGFASELPGCINCRSWIGLPTGPVPAVCATA